VLVFFLADVKDLDKLSLDNNDEVLLEDDEEVLLHNND
jgi:hypothetical protein